MPVTLGVSLVVRASLARRFGWILRKRDSVQYDHVASKLELLG